MVLISQILVSHTFKNETEYFSSYYLSILNSHICTSVGLYLFAPLYITICQWYIFNHMTQCHCYYHALAWVTCLCSWDDNWDTVTEISVLFKCLLSLASEKQIFQNCFKLNLNTSLKAALRLDFNVVPVDGYLSAISRWGLIRIVCLWPENWKADFPSWDHCDFTCLCGANVGRVRAL